MSRQECATHLGLSPSQLDHYVRAYRFANGLKTPNEPPNAPDQKALDILARLRGKTGKHRPERRTPKQPAAPAAQLVPVARTSDMGDAGSGDQLAKLRARIADLETQLDRALGEAHTLQKIVMVLGDRL
jgi:hypothetical protein